MLKFERGLADVSLVLVRNSYKIVFDNFDQMETLQLYESSDQDVGLARVRLPFQLMTQYNLTLNQWVSILSSSNKVSAADYFEGLLSGRHT
jgi:hypothetical protein